MPARAIRNDFLAESPTHLCNLWPECRLIGRFWFQYRDRHHFLFFAWLVVYVAKTNRFCLRPLGPCFVLILTEEVSIMPPTATAENFSGVSCHRCGKPVPVSDQIANRVLRHRSVTAAPVRGTLSPSRVFILRCRSCQKESIYSVNEVVDFSLVEQLP